MAAFIKRMLRNKRAKHQNSWADYRERRQYELEQENLKSSLWLRTL